MITFAFLCLTRLEENRSNKKSIKAVITEKTSTAKHHDDKGDENSFVRARAPGVTKRRIEIISLKPSSLNSFFFIETSFWSMFAD